MLLSKSDFTKFLRCSCYLWLHKFHRDWLPDITASDQTRFEGGHEVDDLARKLFPGGIEIQDFNQEGWESTRSALKAGHHILYQPTVIAGKLTCRADILVYHPASARWDLYEVKSTTSVKDEHLWDVGFQRLCFERAHIPVGRTFLVHVDRTFIRDGEIDPQKFFVVSDVTADVRALESKLPKEIGRAASILEWEPRPGAVQVNACFNPTKCKFIEHYFEKLPVASLRSLHKLVKKDRLIELLERGLLMSRFVPLSTLSGLGKLDIPDPSAAPEISINNDAIKRVLASLKYPVHFLDYETIGPPIPPFDGYRPYQQIPFQYALDVIEKPGGKTKHYEFLAEKFEDPVPALAAQLRKQIGTKGNVVAWNAGFEARCNDLIGSRFPDYAVRLRSVNRRMFDLMLIFKGKNSHYSHSEFEGSASLKNVLPVLIPELAYDDLAIHEGSTASNSWFELTGKALTADERKKLRRDMLAYCGRDVVAMVEIFRLLGRTTRGTKKI